MRITFYAVFIFINFFSASNLFDHATKQYADFLTAQSPEKAKMAQTLLNATSIIKEIEQPEKKDSEDSNDVEVDQKTFDELRFICAKSGSPFLEKINPKTAVGFAHLVKLLTKPATDTQELKKRQKIIGALSNNLEFLETLRQLLCELQQEESVFTTAYPFEKREETISFFKKCGNFIEQAFQPFDLLLSFMEFIATEGHLTNQFSIFNNQRIPLAIKQQFPFIYYTGDQISAADISYQNIASFSAYATTHSFSLVNATKMIFDFTNNCPLGRQTHLFGLLLYGLVYRSKFNLLLNLRNSISNYFINSQKNHRAYKKLLTFYELISLSENFELIEPTSSSETQLKELTAQMKKSTYSGDTFSYFANPHTLYQTEKLIKENQSILKNIYSLVGKADAYITLAQFYKDHKCHFAQYSENKLPILEISEGVHPNGLNYQNLIGNNFFYGQNNITEPIIVSGKNNSGKSFTLKALGLASWMAQTIGFTLTDRPCIITPFDYFKIHANISDSDYDSKFEAEKNELAKLLEKLADLEQKNKKSFLIFDEPLSTTSSVIAEPIVNAIIAMLKNSSYSLSFIITHLHAILTNKNVRQMSIAVKSNKDGTFTSTRKFQNGPSYDNDAAQSLAQALNPALRDKFLTLYETGIANDTQKTHPDLQSKKTIADDDKN